MDNKVATDREVQPTVEHSDSGIITFIISLVMAVSLLVSYFIQINPNSWGLIKIMSWVFGTFFIFLLCLLDLVLGLIDIFSPRRKKVLSLIGIVLNLIVLSLDIILFLQNPSHIIPSGLI